MGYNGTKPWYTSKTVWVNAIALGAALSGASTGFAVSGEEAGALLAVVNLVLRVTTNKGLSS